MANSKYQVIVEGLVKQGTVEKSLKNLEKSLILNINKVQISPQAIQGLQSQLDKLKLNVNVGTTARGGGGTSGGGTSGGGPGFGIGSNYTITPEINALLARIQQIKAEIANAPVKWRVFTTEDAETGEKITRALITYNNLVGDTKKETYAWRDVEKEVNGEIQKSSQWMKVANDYTDDGITKEKAKQREVQKSTAFMEKMTKQAELAIAATHGRKLDTPEVQKVLQAANNLKMAVQSGDVAQMKKFSGEVSVATKEMGNLGKNTLSWSQAMNTALERIIQWGVATMLIYGTMRKIKEAVQYIKDLDKELTNTAIVTGMNKEQIGALAGQYNNLATELGATTIQVAQGSLEWFRQGKTVAETAELVRSSMMMSKLGNMEAAESTEALTAILNGFKLEAEDSVMVIDKLIALDNNYATSTQELSDAIRRSANSAQQAGVTFDELASYVTIVSATTRKSAESIGESFKTMFARMENIKLGKLFEDDATTLSDVEKALSLVNIKIRDTETSFRPMGDVMDEIAAKWNSMNEVEQSAVANAIAGVRQRENFIALMRNYNEVLKAQELQTEATGLATQRFGIYLDSIEAKTNKFIAAWEKLITNTINSNATKFLLDFGTGLLNVVDKAGLLNVVIVALSGILAVKFGVIIPVLTAAIDSMAISMGVAATAATTLSIAIAGGLVGLAIVAAIWAFKELNKNITDTYENFEKLKAQTDSNVNELNSLAQEYETLANKQDRTSEETIRLLDIQSILSTKYGDLTGKTNIYSDAIDGNTAAIQENVRWMKILAQQEAQDFLEEQADAYEKAKKILSDPITVRGSDPEQSIIAQYKNLDEYIKALTVTIEREGDGFLGANRKILNSFLEQRDAARRTIIEYEHYRNVLRETIGDMEDSSDITESLTRNMFEFSDIDLGGFEDLESNLDAIKGKFQELSEQMKGSLDQALNDYIDKQDEAKDKVVELKDAIALLSSQPTLSPEQLTKLGDLQFELANVEAGIYETADAYIHATRIAIIEMAIQKILMSDLSDKAMQTAFDVIANVARTWGILGETTVEAMAAVNRMAVLFAEGTAASAAEAARLLIALGATAAAQAGDYYIRMHIQYIEDDSFYGNQDIPEGVGLPKKPKEPERGDFPGYNPGGVGGGGGGGTAAKPKEEAKSISDLFNMIINKIKQEKKEEIDLLKARQDALQKEQDLLDDQLDKYGEIIDARKEILRTQEDELDYQEDIADRNKSIAKLQNELAVLALDNSQESKARQLELQEELDDQLKDLAETQREHSIDMQETALDKEYSIYEESINKQKQLLQEQSDLIQEQIDKIEEFLSKSGLIAQEAISRITDMTPELYQKLIDWNKEYGSGIDEDVTRAWNEAAAALKEYSNLIDALRGKSPWGGSPSGGAGGGSGESLNWKRQYGLVPGTELWDEATKLGKKKFLELHPEIKKVPQHHTGLDSGPVGNLRTSTNETFAKLMNGEIVLNESDMLGIMKNRLPQIAKSFINNINDSGGININNLINVEGNLDKSCIPDIERISKQVVKNLVNDLTKRGYTRGAQIFST